jgi:dihydroxy-acid dehydratase
VRSSEWFQGNDETAVSHRVVMRSVGLEVPADNTKPIIGIADSSSDLNPCNLPLRALVDDVKAGILEAGGIPVAFPVISLGEDLMKASAMLYRNLLSIEIEENLRSYPLDGIVLLANCDKSVPGALMGAFSADLPTIMVTAGARPAPFFKGKKVGTGTDLWRALDDWRAGRISDEEWREFEECLSCGLGSCNTMGTASSVALMTEMLGFMLPGSATIPANTHERKEAARASGRRIVEMVKENLVPSTIATTKSFRNAIRLLHAIGGSTNAIIHLFACAGRIGGEITVEDINSLGNGIPVLADVEPSGKFLIQDFHSAGGLPQLLKRIEPLMELDALTVTGKPWRAEISREIIPNEAMREADYPLRRDGAFALLKGNIAPDGTLLKVSAASPELFIHSGPAFIFEGYAEMREKLEDPDLPVTKDSVLILRGCGAVGVPGMPEWGMIPIPRKLATEGVKDMIRITDARMSGTSFGLCLLHVSPEAAVGGPLALLQNGDIIDIDVHQRTVNVRLSDAELQARRASWQGFQSEHLRGWPLLYQQHVLQPDQGCDLDFLQAPTKAHRRFIPPVVGRS